MADAVYLSLENAVREAEQLENSGSFTRAEVKYIFLKRARFEYLLRRRRAPAARFLTYIKFETDLYRLHRLRKVQLPGNNNKNLLRNSVAHGLIRKVHSLFQRALGTFHGSVALWLEFTTFCHSHGNQRLLSEVISQALRLNPSCAGLWSFAASWEFKHKSDISAARHLLLRGLRNCRQSKVLWHGYFRLEMLFAEDLHVRRQVLGARESNDGKHEMGVVAGIVFDTAVASHPDDITFNLQFISIAVSYMWAESLMEHMVSHTVGSFCKNDASQDISLQKYCLESLNAGRKTVSNSTLLKFAVDHAMKGDSVRGQNFNKLAHLLRKACKYIDRRGDVHSMDIGKCLLMQISHALLRLVKIASLHVNPHACVMDLAAKTPYFLLNHRYQEAIVLAPENDAWTGILHTTLSLRSSQMPSFGDANSISSVRTLCGAKVNASFKVKWSITSRKHALSLAFGYMCG
mmetsp:Transcript_3035/g.6929  ORF Transcript_3035/g.6929 Transcript_3035/m.6929 type:complete len:461 (+) Transcript_3035:166-1548(+)